MRWPIRFKKQLADTVYQDAGMKLIADLISSLELPGWGADLLPVYTSEEITAIDRGLEQFQKLANQELGGSEPGIATFHPDAAPQIQRTIASQSLNSYADLAWQFSDHLPANWKLVASTYLKAWASNLEPQSLQRVGELLLKADCKAAAKKAFNVILLFPHYAKNLYGNDSRDLTDRIVETAKQSLLGF